MKDHTVSQVNLLLHVTARLQESFTCGLNGLFKGLDLMLVTIWGELPGELFQDHQAISTESGGSKVEGNDKDLRRRMLCEMPEQRALANAPLPDNIHDPRVGLGEKLPVALLLDLTPDKWVLDWKSLRHAASLPRR